MQVLLSSATGRAVLGTWPQYSGGAVGVDGSSRPHVHLDVLRYYLVRSSMLLTPHTQCSGQLTFCIASGGIIVSIAAHVRHICRSAPYSIWFRCNCRRGLRSMCFEAALPTASSA
jgi:hypothetical protein